MIEHIPAVLFRILAQTPGLDRSFLVGGCVRDALLGNVPQDFDIEVFGLNYEQLAVALLPWGRTDLVGRSFGVLKLTVPDGQSFDFSIPRRDSKVAPGHKGFSIEFDPSLTPADAAARRDFTINALMLDPRTKAVLDYFGGIPDLENRILRHTTGAFREDPLRVLRGMQLVSRFALRPAAETVVLCREMKNQFPELAGERVREEWFKWAQKSTVPSAGLRFLEMTEWIDHFPEIKALRGTPQEPEWHPEGDVLTHTGHCCDALVKLPEWRAADVESKIVYSLAVLTHDFGKPSTTQRVEKDGRNRVISPGHEVEGVGLADAFLQRIHAPAGIRARVLPLVANHMVHYQAVTDRAVRRLARRLEPENIHGLGIVMSADQAGRPPLPAAVSKTVQSLLSKAEELQVKQSAARPILQGHHLIELGLSPGESFGTILHGAYEAQLEGEFSDLPQAIEWLKKHSSALLAPPR